MSRTDEQVDTYRQGYEARQRGEPESSNPNPPTITYPDGETFTNDAHHWWWSGWVNGNGGTSPQWYSRTIQGD